MENYTTPLSFQNDTYSRSRSGISFTTERLSKCQATGEYCRHSG